MPQAKYPTIQSFPWQLSIDAVKISLEYDSFEKFYTHLIESMPINSIGTRKKYANIIQRRFFPNRSLNNLSPSVWRYYQDDGLLTDVMRVITLEAEPAVADFEINNILPKSPGSILTNQEVRDFIINIYGDFKKDSYDRLKTISRNLGFLGIYNGQLIVENIPAPENAFLIFLHDRFAHSPQIVRLGEIFEGNWWRYLGLRKPDDVRKILSRAEIAGLIARYAKVDELEQVTTRFSRDKYMNEAMRL